MTAIAANVPTFGLLVKDQYHIKLDLFIAHYESQMEVKMKFMVVIIINIQNWAKSHNIFLE